MVHTEKLVNYCTTTDDADYHRLLNLDASERFTSL